MDPVPVAAPVGPVRCCAQTPGAGARYPHAFHGSTTLQTRGRGGAARAAIVFVFLSIEIIVKMDAFKKRGVNYSRRTLGIRSNLRALLSGLQHRRVRSSRAGPHFRPISSLCVLSGSSIPSSFKLAGATRDIFRSPVSQEQCPEIVVATFLS